MTKLTIGQVAKRAGVGIATIRFYEREGVLAPLQRGTSGYRLFDENAVRRLSFVQRAKSLGFSLKEIRDLLALRVDAEATCADVRARVQEKIADVEEKIESLRQIRDALGELTTSCSGKGSISECPILEAMERAHESS